METALVSTTGFAGAADNGGCVTSNFGAGGVSVRVFVPIMMIDGITMRLGGGGGGLVGSGGAGGGGNGGKSGKLTGTGGKSTVQPMYWPNCARITMMNG